MQVIILAGGEGTRLRPLTQNTPKPLVRLLGISAIERLTALLFKCGFRSATVCDFYLAEKLEKTLGSISNGVKLSYSREDVPLGTAGCVRKAWQGGDVLVLSGDGVCDFDYEKIVEFHSIKQADVTIVSHATQDPREYGLVTADESGKILGFCEKPSFDSCLTDIANTGVYVISQEVIKRVPIGEKTDFAKDVFPQLLSEGKRLYTCVEQGIWQDVGDIPSLLKCQAELLEKEKLSSLVLGDANVHKSAIIGKGSAIEQGAFVGENCRISGSLVMKNSSLGEGCVLNNCVIGENVTVGRGCKFGQLCCIGEGTVISSNVVIESGIRVAPNSKIPYGARVFADITGGSYLPFSFSENGVCQGISTPQQWLRLGLAVANALGISAITVGTENCDTPEAQALILGLRSGGALVNFATATMGQTVFAARHLKTEYAIFIGKFTHLLRADRLSLARSEERKIELLYNKGDVKQNTFAPIASAEAVANEYVNWLRAEMPENFAVKFKTKSRLEQKIFSKIAQSQKAELSFHQISGELLATQESAKANGQELLLLACLDEFEQKRGAVLPETAPFAAEELAQKHGVSVTRVSTADSLEIPYFAFDSLALIAKVSSYLAKHEISLLQAILMLPPKIYSRKIYGVKKELPKIMHQGFSDITQNGKIFIDSGFAKAQITPLKNGKAIRLYVESVSQEAATELVNDVIKRLGKTYKP